MSGAASSVLDHEQEITTWKGCNICNEFNIEKLDRGSRKGARFFLLTGPFCPKIRPRCEEHQRLCGTRWSEGKRGKGHP